MIEIRPLRVEGIIEIRIRRSLLDIYNLNRNPSTPEALYNRGAQYIFLKAYLAESMELGPLYFDLVNWGGSPYFFNYDGVKKILYRIERMKDN